MRSYFAKGEKTNNSEELDKVMCSIMNQNFKPASFFLFGWLFIYLYFVQVI